MYSGWFCGQHQLLTFVSQKKDIRRFWLVVREHSSNLKGKINKSYIFMYERLLPVELIATQRLNHMLCNWGKIKNYLKAMVLYMEDWLICTFQQLLWIFTFWKIKLALHYPVFPLCFLALWQMLAYSINICS